MGAMKELETAVFEIAETIDQRILLDCDGLRDPSNVTEVRDMLGEVLSRTRIPWTVLWDADGDCPTDVGLAVGDAVWKAHVMQSEVEAFYRGELDGELEADPASYPDEPEPDDRDVPWDWVPRGFGGGLV